MNTDEEKSNDKISKDKEPARSSSTNWGMVVFGILAVGVGILSTTPVITNPFYRGLWWFLILLGIVAILWGFVSGKCR